MTKEDIIRMAREAGIEAEADTLCRYEGFVEPLEHFAKLVAEHERDAFTAHAMTSAEKAIDVAIKLEREACAKMCEEYFERVMASRIRTRGQE